MKGLVAREFLFFFIGLIAAIPAGFLFLKLLDLHSASSQMSQDERVFEMELFITGALLGFVGVYIARFTVWAVKQVLVAVNE